MKTKKKKKMDQLFSSYLIWTQGQNLTISRSNISKLQIWYWVNLEMFCEYLQIKNFFQKSGFVTFLLLRSPNLMQKIRKILRAVSEETALPTNQPIITNNTDLIGPHTLWSKKLPNILELDLKNVNNYATRITNYQADIIIST